MAQWLRALIVKFPAPIQRSLTIYKGSGALFWHVGVSADRAFNRSFLKKELLGCVYLCLYIYISGFLIYGIPL